VTLSRTTQGKNSVKSKLPDKVSLILLAVSRTVCRFASSNKVCGQGREEDDHKSAGPTPGKRRDAEDCSHSCGRVCFLQTEEQVDVCCAEKCISCQGRQPNKNDSAKEVIIYQLKLIGNSRSYVQLHVLDESKVSGVES
jgi:hypothetical protein